MELTKKDWEDVLKQTNIMTTDAMINLEILKTTAAKARMMINEFPEETGKSDEGQSEVKPKQP